MHQYSSNYFVFVKLSASEDPKMMPPKKSKAARDFETEDQDAIQQNGETNPEVSKEEEEDDEEEAPPPVKKHVNIFSITVVDGRRERKVPPSETYFKKWCVILD